MADSTDFLKDYVQVKDRVKALFDLYGQARIETTYEITREPDDRAKVICRALVFRNPEDTQPAGMGTSWLYLPGTTNFTKGSEIENAETSAVGRAIGFLGILTEKGLASANEIANKQGQSEPDVRQEITTDGGLIGTAEKGTVRTSDYLLRQSPDGGFLGFRLKGGGRKAGFLVEAHGDLAQALALVESDVIDQRCQVWGHWVERKLQKGSYQAFYLERITTPSITLPASSDPSEAGPTTNGTPTDRAGRTSEEAPETPASSPSSIQMPQGVIILPGDVTEREAREVRARWENKEIADLTDGAAIVLPSGKKAIFHRVAGAAFTTPVEEAGAIAETAEVPSSVPDDGGAGAEGPTDEPRASVPLCGKAGPYAEGETCVLPRTHRGPHTGADKATWL